ncbi:hypothetical protein H6F86_20930 [Phormidium sp. FACHB-592]|uniref:AAA+ ATPase domain-containing protein n=1 Tax=Stenomitos frigidus AS-A4 TaxID=2933935 RepID=A0ABV0KH88_9CYAN|nr:hypothetical protein [Phormidium sp. FACHB-592]MBD2076299.1 hypothetical protein [Phormidium sp. FACHB-592]
MEDKAIVLQGASRLAPVRVSEKLQLKDESEASGQTALAAFGFAGAVWLLTANPIGAIAALGVGFFIYTRVDSKEEDRAEAINGNALSAALKPQQLDQYLQEVGSDRVRAELQWAERQHINLPRKQRQLLAALEADCPHDVLALSQGELIDQTRRHGIKAVLEAFEAAIADGHLLNEMQKTYVSMARQKLGVTASQNVGVETRLNAIAVDSQADPTVGGVQPQPVAPQALTEPAPTKPATQAPDITDFIIDQGNSLVFLGGQGVGKSRLMAITSQRGLEQGKYKHVTVLSGLAKANEDPIYWQHCVNQLFFDLAPMDDRDRELALAKQLKAIQDFKNAANSENPGLLILDEIAFQAAVLARSGEHTVQYALQKEITDILRVVCSGGAKRGWFVWVGTPQGAIGDMGDIGRAIKKLKPVCCAIAPMSAVKSRGHSTTWDEGLYQAAKLNFPALYFPPSTMSDRIVFFDGRWLPQTRHELQTAKPSEAKQSGSKAQDLKAAIDKIVFAALKGRGFITAAELRPYCAQFDPILVLKAYAQSQPDHFYLRDAGASDVLLGMKQTAKVEAKV